MNKDRPLTARRDRKKKLLYFGDGPDVAATRSLDAKQ
ncbi:hypothetical protein BIW11_03456 [Tropilaelaps mercedesae]|uniref:Uncharacterized protein n=1 Tax=Tropilaelaps mercedesae TaxID=418985 RepID=A0A1V9XL48_9ACAR|nr:hypothetical protein BIW11_03456 [Tropilaelaps mercedesae]